MTSIKKQNHISTNTLTDYFSYREMVPHLSKQPEVYDRVILLIRDPFDSLLAEFHRKFSGEQHTGFASIEKFSKPCTEKDQVRELWGTVYFKSLF